MSIGAEDWLATIEREYLGDYVRDGGAAVKLVVAPDDRARADVAHRVAEMGARQGFMVAHVDSAQTKVHMVQEVFFQIARQTDWQALARRSLRLNYRSAGIQVAGDELSVERIADANGVDPGMLHAELRQRIEDVLRRGDLLTKDFRLAVTWLCTYAATNPEVARPIVEWLEGELRLVSALKRFLIFRKIGRHNARAMLSSLAAWARMLELSGLVVVIDLHQVAIASRAKAGSGLYYTGPMAMDAYEVVRQLIDGTDEASGLFTVVLVPPELFEESRRSIKQYKALDERTRQEVKVRDRDNPLSALTTISASVE